MLFIVLIVNCDRIFAQSIKGHLVASVNQTSIAGAKIDLVEIRPNSVLKTVQSDNQGNFEISLKGIILQDSAIYQIAIHAIGFGDIDISLPAWKLKNGIALNNIEMFTSELKLDEVSIVARKKMLSRQIDRWVLEPYKNPNAAGMNAFESFRLLPGVNALDEKISVNGKSGVKYLLNGRPTIMSASNIIDFLKGLKPDQIEKIELLTTPPAKYSAEGTAAIINIELKKNVLNGFSGKLSSQYEQGKYNASRNSATLGYKTLGFESTSYLNGNFTNTLSDGRENRVYTNNGGGTTNLNADYFERHKGRTLSYFQSLAFNLSKSSNLNIDYLLSYDRDIESVISRADISSGTTAYTLTNNDTGTKSFTYGLTGTYSADLDSLKKNKIEFSASLFSNDNPRTSLVNNQFFQPNGSPSQNAELNDIKNDFKGNLYGLSADYSLKPRVGQMLEAGLKYSRLENRSNFRFISNTIQDQANNFKYDEGNLAAYLSYAFKIKKIDFKLGLRGEYTNYKGTDPVAGVSLDSTYFKLFPTAYVGFQFSENIGFSANYSKRILRPDFRDLNPFRYYFDPYSYTEGNPFLRPYFIDNIETEFSFWDSLYLTMGYGFGRNVIADLTRRNGSDLSVIVFKGNLTRERNLYANLSGQSDFYKWWNMSWSVNFSRNVFQGGYAEYQIDNKISSWSLNLYNNFSLSKSFSFSFGGWLNGPTSTGIDRYRTIGRLNASFQKKYKAFAFQFGINDIFNTQRERVSTTLSDQYIYLDQRHDYRRGWLRVVWSFDNNKKWISNKKNKIKKNFDDDESRLRN
ncbi:TonB-dependent receptor [Pedobacter petrophilus]|uniref:TonB-dependent receptor n=1 Tax=Pedobacter petrophilus TaxID=1908241 RepID=A0A7K0FU56_9SPHI|nr:outer membrane beta-barrel family protein [Pedobacter petrophilus]MRX74479.1 TonB-dependent receptor [Pedobacter petrophilus]